MSGIPWLEQRRRHRPEGPPSRTQMDCLRAIEQYAGEMGVLPTFGELGKWLGISRQGAHALACRLRDKGLLGRDRRGQMTLTDKGRQALGAGQ